LQPLLTLIRGESFRKIVAEKDSLPKGARPFLSACPICRRRPLKAVRGESFRKIVAEKDSLPNGARPFLSVCTIRSPLKEVRGESFRKVVAELEGYDSSGMGEVMREA
jgi:hypothetical protein